MFKLKCVKLWDLHLELLISVALVLSSVYSVIAAPHAVCMFEDCKSARITTIFTIFPRAVAIGCIASRITTVYSSKTASRRYDDKIEVYGGHYPMGEGKETLGRLLVALVIAVNAVVILPINVYRVHSLHDTFHSIELTTFFALMYVQNVTVCMAEVQFFGRCVGLYLRFRAINEEMSALKSETIVANRYPSILKTDERQTRHVDLGGPTTADDCPSAVQTCPLVNIIEQLKLRHKYMSNAVRKLNELYGMQLGLSLSVLFLMTLSDLYEFLVQAQTKTRERKYYYMWLVQYSFRFCMIVTITHITAKEAHKSKNILTDINNRSIDNTAKEELQLFLNELSSRSVDFTAYDLFIINTHLITSAIVTGTTFLIILFQFH